MSDVFLLRPVAPRLSLATFTLPPGISVLGRSPTCDLFLDDKSVSREHAEIVVAASRVTVTDLDSTNGTFLDDMPVVRCTVVADGQRLRFGFAAMLLIRHVQENGEDDQPTPESKPVSASGPTALTQGEWRVLERLLDGCSEKDVGRCLNISHKTVHSHVKAIYRKLGVHSRAELLLRPLPKSGPAVS